MLVLALQTFKVGGHFPVLRGRRNALEPCQYQRVVFGLAGAALCDVANVFFCESAQA